jgi:L-lactate dehydrogenase complex protein LldG
MSSRDKILATVKQNQPASAKLPELINYDQHYEDVVEKYIEVLRFIGGEVHVVENYNQVLNIIKGSFQHAQRIISTCKELATVADINPVVSDPHELANVDLFITTSNLAVAENGAVWIKDDQLPSRALPFIAQQIAVIITKESIVATMHDAYDVIADADYGYAAFIAGPSKTADIAQSLVLGAHGPKTMTVFLIQTT